MKVQLVRAKSHKRWYAQENESILGKTFRVVFSERQSKKLGRSVFEILQGKHKGRFIDVKDTRIKVKV